MSKTPITVAYGDGIGPEIMTATLRILEAAGAQLDIETIDIGEKVYLAGNTSGIPQEAWDSLLRTKIFLKAPITTPQGGGYKSLNVTTRKALGLYANVRPCVSYNPFIASKHPEMDVVIVRENEEDLYAGIEYRQTNDVYQCLKLISRPGSEKICRYAFEYARTNNRKKVTCFIKDNIMKLTDGIFHKVFDEIAEEYPEIESESLIVDIGSAFLAERPGTLDVIVTENLYGDIISDIAAQITGSVGLAGSANIGDDYAMFEAIHGSAPNIAGKNIANPSGLLMGAVMMLAHIGQYEVAEKIHNAWLTTIEDGILTADLFNEDLNRKKVGTAQFADEVIQRLGEKPNVLKPVSYSQSEDKKIKRSAITSHEKEKKELVGVDIFLDWTGSPEELGNMMNAFSNDTMKLTGISNRGVSVWPNAMPNIFCSDQWRCRFESEGVIKHSDIINMLGTVNDAGYDFIKTEHLYKFNGKEGYSRSQGQ
jgi:isocitrate dehydrogenase